MPEQNIAELAQLISRRAQELGRVVLVGVDGAGGSGKSTLAELLSVAMPDSVMIHVDDFYLPSAQRPEQQDGIADNFDLARLRAEVLEPAKNGSAVRYQRYDWDTDALAEWTAVPAGTPLFVEGVYSTQLTLRDFYTFRIFCDTDREVRLRRGLDRDGEESRSQWVDEWMPAEDRYLGKEAPQSSADLVVNGSNQANSPTPVFEIEISR